MSDLTALEFGPVHPTEVDTLRDILHRSFPSLNHHVDHWLTDGLGIQQFRVVRRGGEVLAGASYMPMGQWYGGRRVPVMGLTANGVLPEQRGKGIAHVLGQHQLREIHITDGPGLAICYGSTLRRHRLLGFERAGTCIYYELPLHAIDAHDRSLEVTLGTATDHDTIRTLYTRRAQATAGNLDRHPMLWREILGTREEQPSIYLALQAGIPVGYIVFDQQGMLQPISIRDICFLTRAAGLRLLTFLKEHNLADRIRWSGGPADPLLHLLGEQSKHKVTYMADWLVRIVTVEKALADRGYPKSLQTELHLEVADEELPWNNGRFILELSHGEGRVTRGGNGSLKLGIRELAALYTGHLTSVELQSFGSLTAATSSDLQLADLIFSGPKPWMPDSF